MIPKILIGEGVITVRQLKEWVKNLAEKNEYGEDFEVWMDTGEMLSSPVTEICPLNRREDGCDVCFSVGAEYSWEYAVREYIRRHGVPE
jgi:hypothetical protein